MAPRPPRPDDQIRRLAEELGRRWVDADGIEPWLRRQLPWLTRQNEDGWTWDDIGRAMTLASITYATGRPWTGGLLARKVGETRAQLRSREARRLRGTEAKHTKVRARAVVTPAINNPPPPPASVPFMSMGQTVTEDDGPAIRPTFKLSTPRGLMPPPPSPAPAPDPATPNPQNGVDARITRFLKSKP